MERKLPWALIKSTFKNKWVELIDVDWDWNEACPSRARIRHVASDRENLMLKIHSGESVSDSVVLYLGFTGSVVNHSVSSASV